MRIFVINPGSTSTKIAVFMDLNRIFQENIQHSAEELSPYKHPIEQYDFRKKCILETLEKAFISMKFDAIIARGGLIHPMPSGVYRINKQMIYDLTYTKHEHACNLGALLAVDIAEHITYCPAFIADPEVVDEMTPEAHLTGLPEISRISIFHALNQKAIAHKYASSLRKKYEKLNLIVVHMGGGISIGAHLHGKVIDVNNALNGDGPYSPERAGTLPADQLIELCFSGKYSKQDLKNKICGKGGLSAHLGTNYIPELVKEAEEGNEKVALILRGMIYGIAKYIGAMYVVLEGKVDAILITGGIAYSNYCTSMLKEKIEFIAPVFIYPGEDEMESLAYNAYQAMKGNMIWKEYKG